MTNLRLAHAIQNKAGPASGLRVGVVQSVDDASNLTAIVGGATVPVSYLSSYAPTPGDNVCILYFGAVWLALGAVDAAVNPQSQWITYTPSWVADTTNPAIGNGTITGNYKILGGIGFATINISTGSSTTFGSGGYSFGLPFNLGGSSTAICGSGYVFDASAGVYYAGSCGVSGVGNNYARLRTHAAGNCSASVPVTLASGDALDLIICAEVD